MKIQSIIIALLTSSSCFGASLNLVDQTLLINNGESNSYADGSMLLNSYVKINAGGELTVTGNLLADEAAGIDVFGKLTLGELTIKSEIYKEGAKLEPSWIKIQQNATATIGTLHLDDYGYFQSRNGASITIASIVFNSTSPSFYGNSLILGGNVTLGGTTVVTGALDADIALGYDSYTDVMGLVVPSATLSLNLLGTMNASKISVGQGFFSMLITNETILSWKGQVKDNFFDVFVVSEDDAASKALLYAALTDALSAYDADHGFTVAWREEGGYQKLSVSNMAIPESSTATMGLVGLSALLLCRRRRPQA